MCVLFRQDLLRLASFVHSVHKTFTVNLTARWSAEWVSIPRHSFLSKFDAITAARVSDSRAANTDEMPHTRCIRNQFVTDTQQSPPPPPLPPASLRWQQIKRWNFTRTCQTEIRNAAGWAGPENGRKFSQYFLCSRSGRVIQASTHTHTDLAARKRGRVREFPIPRRIETISTATRIQNETVEHISSHVGGDIRLESLNPLVFNTRQSVFY